MSDKKYTPGPWDDWGKKTSRFSATGPTCAASIVARSAISEGGWSFYCEVAAENKQMPCLAFGDTQEQANANASLIACAPELLEILEKVIYWQSSLTCPASLVGQAKDIIAKAKGETK